MRSQIKFDENELGNIFKMMFVEIWIIDKLFVSLLSKIHVLQSWVKNQEKEQANPNPKKSP